MHSRGCLPPATPAMRAVTDLYARRQPGQAPHRAALRPSTPPHSDVGKRPRNQTQHGSMNGRAQPAAHRAGTSAPGSAGQRQQNAGLTEPSPKIRACHKTHNRTRRSRPHPVLPSPAQRGAARCHDQHKLTQPAWDRRSSWRSRRNGTPGQKHKLCSRDRTRTYNLPVNSRTLCRLSYAGSTRIRVAHSERACDAERASHLPFTSPSSP